MDPGSRVRDCAFLTKPSFCVALASGPNPYFKRKGPIELLRDIVRKLIHGAAPLFWFLKSVRFYLF